MRVAIVGGGVIGLCLAEALARRGAEVVLIDASSFGAAASAGNAGWVCPGVSNPVPAPGTVSKALRWMVNPHGPLFIRPLLQASYIRWLYDFWRHTRPGPYCAGLAALVALSRRTLADFDALAARCNFEMHREGLLFVANDEAALAAELEVLEDHRRFGYEGRIVALDHEQALAHEPALSDRLAGAILAVDERHVRPETLSRGLAVCLQNRGVELRENTAVRRISNPNHWVLDCDGTVIRADRLVLAAGVATPSLLRPLGITLPLVGAKGYSITLEAPTRAPRGPIYILESKVAVTPFDRALRLAGTLELGSRGLGLNRSRIASIERAGNLSLRDWSDHPKAKTWAGLRSLLPDGLPVIGAVPGFDGLYVATGHAMLGVTLAPTTAELLATTILEEKASLELTPFSIARFGNRGGGRARMIRGHATAHGSDRGTEGPHI